MFFFSSGLRVNLISPEGRLESSRLGFNIFVLFFGALIPLIYGDYFFAALLFALRLVFRFSGNISYQQVYYSYLLVKILGAAYYGRYHIKKRLNNGWRPATDMDEEILRVKGFSWDHRQQYDSGQSQSYQGYQNYQREAKPDPTAEPSWKEEAGDAIDAEFEDQ